LPTAEIPATAFIVSFVNEYIRLGEGDIPEVPEIAASPK
tara:strand:- start:573 stop:689 length:117 start_codon:yes stop_codon:yes gene_type:complete